MSGTAGVIYTFVVVQASMIVRGTDSVFDTVYEIAGAPIRVAMMLIVWAPASVLSLVSTAISIAVADEKEVFTPELGEPVTVRDD